MHSRKTNIQTVVQTSAEGHWSSKKGMFPIRKALSQIKATYQQILMLQYPKVLDFQAIYL